MQDDKKRAKLIIYINPPYAEDTTATTITGTGNNKANVSKNTMVYTTPRYFDLIQLAARELFAQFLIRIYLDIPNCIIAQFSTPKHLQAQNFNKFRLNFKAKLCSSFIVPSYSFDNVSGKFPIGFFIWDTKWKEIFKETTSNVFDTDNSFIDTKKFFSISNDKYIINWLRLFYDKNNKRISYLRMIGTDMQNNSGVFFTNNPSDNDIKKRLTCDITQNNIIPMCIYLSVRHCIECNWLNNRDQFLFPNDNWQSDKEFKSDCLTFALFNTQNKIIGKDNINYWIPFTEEEVGAKGLYRSHLMTDFIQGKIKQTKEADLFDDNTKQDNKPLTFSLQAQEVFSAAKELWKYYHQTAGSDDNKDKYDANASYYDIREFFQGRDAQTGRMNNSSPDEKYNDLVGCLRLKEKELGDKIAKKVYQYGFLR